MADKYEWYTLNSSLQRDTVIEGFESFIWTERYSSFGDFQIITKSTRNARTLLQPGVMVAMKGSYYTMFIDTVIDETAEDGTRNLTVTGKSLEALLNDRVAMPAITDTTTTPAWVLSDTPGNVIKTMFTDICVTGVINAGDVIPQYHSGTLLADGNIGEPTDLITVSAPPDTLYNTIKKIADTYFLGFRMPRDGDTGNVYFEVYVGSDRTSTQATLPPVVFDPNMDNLEKPTLLSSTAAVKTVAYVFAQNGSAMVYAVGADATATGAGRRVLLVNSSNSDPAGATLDAALQNEGLTALANQRLVYAFTGELPQHIPYVYGTDYFLGDLVEERNGTGYGNQLLVTEQIFSSDHTGERSYPTLTIKQLITPGTWVTEPSTLHWTDEDPSVIWATL
jgi:hypothetical protein